MWLASRWIAFLLVQAYCVRSGPKPDPGLLRIGMRFMVVRLQEPSDVRLVGSYDDDDATMSVSVSSTIYLQTTKSDTWSYHLPWSLSYTTRTQDL